MQKITSIGEILFDIYPEAKKLGGAPFNFIYHIIKLTGSGNFISRIGNDSYGIEINQFLNLNNISTEFLQIDSFHPTGTAKPVLNEQKIPDWIIEENSAYNFIEKNKSNESLVDQSDCLYFGTLAQRGEESGKTIQSFFNKKSIKYFCDLNIRQKFYTKKIIENSLITADVLKLNLDELKLLNELILSESSGKNNLWKNFDVIKTSQDLLEKFNISIVCVTQGEEGAFLFKDKDVSHYKVNVNEIVDTVGAGDAYASILCLGFLNNWDLEKINKKASEFAAEIIKINGALPADKSLYENFKEELIK